MNVDLHQFFITRGMFDNARLSIVIDGCRCVRNIRVIANIIAHGFDCSIPNMLATRLVYPFEIFRDAVRDPGSADGAHAIVPTLPPMLPVPLARGLFQQ